MSCRSVLRQFIYLGRTACRIKFYSSATPLISAHIRTFLRHGLYQITSEHCGIKSFRCFRPLIRYESLLLPILKHTAVPSSSLTQLSRIYDCSPGPKLSYHPHGCPHWLVSPQNNIKCLFCAYHLIVQRYSLMFSSIPSARSRSLSIKVVQAHSHVDVQSLPMSFSLSRDTSP